VTDANKPPLERALFALITRGWDAGKVSGYAATLRQRDKVMPAEILHTFASIDAKATGLLTHTSMMIAGLGLLAPLVASNEVEMAIVLAEIGVYMLIALGCLRCLSVFRTHEFVDAGDRAPDIVHHELIVRSELYSLCIRAAIIFSIVVFLLLPVLYFWAPGK
jgi:hypothetical protein